MCEKFRPDEMFISSGSDGKDNLMFFPKLLEKIQHLSGRYFRCGRNIKIGVLEQFGFTSYRYQIHCKVRNLHRVWMNFSMTKKNEKSTHLVISYINSLFGILFFHIFERSDCLLPDWRPLRWLLLLI